MCPAIESFLMFIRLLFLTNMWNVLRSILEMIWESKFRFDMGGTFFVMKLKANFDIINAHLLF